MAGMEVVRTLQVDGEEFTVYGTYSETNEMYDFYDIYVLNPDGGVLELVDLGEPFVDCPTDEEIRDIARSLVGSPVIPIERHAV